MSLFVAHTLPKFETWAKLVVWYLPHFPPARRATTACTARTFAKVEQTNNPSAGLQGVALILFKFCLISEAQPHSSSTTSHPIFSFPHFLISSFPHFPRPSCYRPTSSKTLLKRLFVRPFLSSVPHTKR